ncbi:MAG: 2Fe-2S iron-sulfur cluster-binding protein, partial [Planctomycetota bacterium]
MKLTIDGKQITAQPGQTVLQAAQDNGIDIPNLCYDPRLKPSGSCRLCLVEIEGQRGLQPSCVFEAQDGLVVKTNTDEIREVRKTMLELLFDEHKARCTVCDENGNCDLQSYAYEYQLDEQSLGRPLYAEPVVNYTTGNLALEYDPNKCIRCGRCVRICDEVQMAHALTFKNRAAETEVTTAFDLPLNESTCV